MKLTSAILIIILFIALAWNAQNAQAELHMDFGLLYHDQEFDSFKQDDDSISSIIGEVELSYEFENGSSIFIRHLSSTQQRDTGLNTIGIKARLF